MPGLGVGYGICPQSWWLGRVLGGDAYLCIIVVCGRSVSRDETQKRDFYFKIVTAPVRTNGWPSSEICWKRHT